MNYNQEPFPEDINLLIQKCETIILKIQERFSSPECLIVKDLYHTDKGHKQKDFIQKLQVVCNNKKEIYINPILFFYHFLWLQLL